METLLGREKSIRRTVPEFLHSENLSGAKSREGASSTRKVKGCGSGARKDEGRKERRPLIKRRKCTPLGKREKNSITLSRPSSKERGRAHSNEKTKRPGRDKGNPE